MNSLPNLLIKNNDKAERGMAATIRDVARQANVSVATVSRYVNGTNRVRGETAERVKAAIEALGFRPNAVGRSLSTSYTKSLGVVIPSISNPVFADAVEGITNAVKQHGYTLMLTSTNYDPDEELSAVGTLLENRVDGIILTVADPQSSPALSLLEKSGVPYVLVYNQPSPGKPTVTVDNAGAGRDVACEFARQGHQRLGMVSGRFRSSDRAVARRDGFLAGAAEAGLKTPVICEADHEGRQLEKSLDQLYEDLSVAPTGLFCSNDLLAISVIGYLQQRNIQVPEQVSVIGFDGIAVGNHLYPTLATIVQPSQEMGSAAAHSILGRLSGKASSEEMLLPYIFRKGDSAGPAGKLTPASSPNLSKSIRRRSTK